jgi:hypothetical protein
VIIAKKSLTILVTELVWKQVSEEGVVLRTNFFFPSHTSGTCLSDDSLVITRSCTITKLRLLLIQSLTDPTQTLTDAHSASLQIAY